MLRPRYSERDSEIEREMLTLEAIFDTEIVRPFEGRGSLPGHVCQSDLRTGTVQPVVDIGLERIGAGIVSDLPLAVAQGPQLEKESGISERYILADAQIETCALARRDVRIFDFL